MCEKNQLFSGHGEPWMTFWYTLFFTYKVPQYILTLLNTEPRLTAGIKRSTTTIVYRDVGHMGWDGRGWYVSGNGGEAKEHLTEKMFLKWLWSQTFLQSLYRKSQPIKMSSILTSLDGSPAFTPAPVRISPTRGHRRVLWHHPIRERLPAFSTGLLSTSGRNEESKEIYQDLVFFP